MKVFIQALVEWAKTPSGHKTLVALAAALGAAIEQVISAAVK